MLIFLSILTPSKRCRPETCRLFSTTHVLIADKLSNDLLLLIVRLINLQSVSELVEHPLCDIITGDETWIYHRQIGRKSSNSIWVYENEPSRTIVRRNRYEPKTLFCLFFKSTGPVLIHKVDRAGLLITTTILKIVSYPLSMK